MGANRSGRRDLMDRIPASWLFKTEEDLTTIFVDRKRPPRDLLVAPVIHRKIYFMDPTGSTATWYAAMYPVRVRFCLSTGVCQIAEYVEPAYKGNKPIGLVYFKDSLQELRNVFLVGSRDELLSLFHPLTPILFVRCAVSLCFALSTDRGGGVLRRMCAKVFPCALAK